VLVNYIRDYQIRSGVAKAEAYTFTMYLMAALLVVGFVCNLLVNRKLQTQSQAPATATAIPTAEHIATRDRVPWGTLAFRWAWVGVPLAWGVAQTVRSSLALFK
jgi:hypothetical protein